MNEIQFIFFTGMGFVFSFDFGVAVGFIRGLLVVVGPTLVGAFAAAVAFVVFVGLDGTVDGVTGGAMHGVEFAEICITRNTIPITKAAQAMKINKYCNHFNFESPEISKIFSISISKAITLISKFNLHAI